MKDYRRSWRKPWWILGVVGASALTVIKSITSFFQLGHIGGVLLTMMLSIWAYTLVAPFELAVGVAVLLLVHELGHVIAAKSKGLPVTAPVFIPFIGALITLKKNPRNVETEAYIALGGPVLGTIGAWVVYVLGSHWESPLLIAIANVGFLFNLINLIPMRPLDGGRVVAAVSRWLWLVGLVGGFWVAYQLSSYFLLIVWVLFALDLLRKLWKRPQRRESILVWSDVQIPLANLTPAQQNILKGHIPSELPYTTYSILSTSQQMLRITWDDIGLKEFVKLPRQLIIHQVRVAKVNHHIDGQLLKLSVRCKVNCDLYVDDAYYTISTGKRWAVGLVYSTLAVFLIYILNEINNIWVSS